MEPTDVCVFNSIQKSLSICIHFTVDYLSLLLKCRLWFLCKGRAVGALISDISYKLTGRLVFVVFFPFTRSSNLPFS